MTTLSAALPELRRGRRSGGGRCPYCRARLATVSCPSCFALMFDGAAFCPKCGAAGVRAGTRRVGAACPACRSELQRVDVGATPLLECAACDGVWVDADEFERICAEREAQAAVLHRLSTPARRRSHGPRAATARACGAER